MLRSCRSECRFTGCFFLFVTAVFAGDTSHECIHDSHIVPSMRAHDAFPYKVSQVSEEAAEAEEPTDNTTVLAGRRLVSGGVPFRIHVDYAYLALDGRSNGGYQCVPGMRAIWAEQGRPYTCRPQDIVTNELKQYIVRLTEAAKTWWESALRVLHPPRGPLRLHKYCYTRPPPPNGDAATQIQSQCRWPRRRNLPDCDFNMHGANYYLTVTATPTTGNTLAWAMACQSDDQTGRPTAGLVNYGPHRLTMRPENWETELATAKHEMAHALGFSSSLYDQFVDSELRLLGEDNVVQQFRRRGERVQKIVTPRVAQAVKEHYDCHDWSSAGGELENSGGTGTAGSHWEKRVFRDEFMTGTISPVPAVSAISLALFEDSGWYSVDYGVTDYFHWGNKAGCSFPEHGCNNWPSKFFCEEAEELGCTHNHVYKGHCNAVDFENRLAWRHRYFWFRPRHGGRDALADNCPYTAGYSNADCRKQSDQNRVGVQVFGERHGSNSRCFQSSAVNRRYNIPDRQPGQMDPRCHQFECNDGDLTVIVSGARARCPRQGGIVTLSRHRFFHGEVVCPPAEEICTSQTAAPTELLSHALLSIGSPFSLLQRGNETTLEPERCRADSQVEREVGELEHLAVLERDGDEVEVFLNADSTAYFRIALDAGTEAGLELQSRGVVGSVYVRSMDVDLNPPMIMLVPERSLSLLSLGGSQSLEDFPQEMVQMPSCEYNDVSWALGVDGPNSFRFSRSIIGSGSMILLAVDADAGATEGFLSLSSVCTSECLNNGQCQSGGCACADGWSGADCSDRECPNECSGHGLCNSQSGICSCGAGWQGDDCGQEAPTASPDSGTIAIGEWAFFHLECERRTDAALHNRTEDVTLTYTMQKLRSQADAFLFAQVGRARPSQFDYIARDINNWRIGDDEQTISLTVQSGQGAGATIGIWNAAEYSLAPLPYRGTKTCHYHVTLPYQRAPCPATRSGECNGKGICNAESGTPECVCDNGWFSDACDERTAEVPGNWTQLQVPVDEPMDVGNFNLSPLETVFVQLMTPSSAYGKRMMVRVDGFDAWLGISLNVGTRRPSRFHPKRSHVHNWPMGSDDPTIPSRVVVRSVDSASYSIMLTNPLNSGSAAFALQVMFQDTSDESQSPDELVTDVLLSQSNAGLALCDPGVPTAEQKRDGGLPPPMLIMTSRSGIRGVAGCQEMRLLKVEEFCRSSRTGFYRMCSNSEGELLICSDQPIIVFHNLGENRRPRQQIDFARRSQSLEGPPPDSAARLQQDGVSCAFHANVPIESESSFVGISQLNVGRPAQFTTVMHGHTRFWTNDQGEIKGEWPLITMGIVASLLTAFVVAYCCYSKWFREQYKKHKKSLVMSNFVEKIRSVRELRLAEQQKAKTSVQRAASQRVVSEVERMRFKTDHLDGLALETKSRVQLRALSADNELEDMLEHKAEIDVLYDRKMAAREKFDREMRERAEEIKKTEADLQRINLRREEAEAKFRRVVAERAEIEVQLEKRRATIREWDRETLPQSNHGRSDSAPAGSLEPHPYAPPSPETKDENIELQPHVSEAGVPQHNVEEAEGHDAADAQAGHDAMDAQLDRDATPVRNVLNQVKSWETRGV